MKNKILGGCFFASAVVAVCLAGTVCSGQAQPASPGSSVALPPNIEPGTPLAEVVKLVQVGVDIGIIKTYIANAASAFNLDADKIISLTDLGVTSDLVNAMMEHDKNYAGVATTAVAPPPLAPAPAVVDDGSATAAPATEVDVNYFNNTLSPYGSWVEVEGYGRCWRPTTVLYDASWQPYCNRGHWVYSDSGWYWDSDYSWGVTFHYGRWFHHDRFGWCWWPDTVWAPSWVTWRQSDAYCGWAPLPPFAEFRPGRGFYYRGASVAVGFDFGLEANFFTFVPVGNFCDRQVRSFRVEPARGREIFRQATVINNYNDNHRTIFNGGISVERINAATHRNLTPVHVGAIHDAERAGWRGPVTPEDRAARNSYNQSSRQNPDVRDNHNNVNNRQNFNQPNPAPGRNENMNAPFHPQAPGTSGNHNFNSSGNERPVAAAPYVRHQPAPVLTPVTPAAPVRVMPQENVRPARNYTDAVISAPPPQHAVPQAEVVMPSPAREQRIEQRQNPVEVAPHNVAPPAAAPAQNQPRSSGQGSGNPDRNKQNQ